MPDKRTMYYVILASGTIVWSPRMSFLVRLQITQVFDTATCGGIYIERTATA